MTEIINFEGKLNKRRDKEAKPGREQWRDFRNLVRDFDVEASDIYDRWVWRPSGDCCAGWLENSSRELCAKMLLDQTAKLHDLAKRLLEEAIREEQDKAS